MAVRDGLWLTFGLLTPWSQVSTGYINYFDKLSALLLEIGRSAPATNELALVYPDSSVLQSLLCEYLAYLVQLCRRAIQFTKKPALSQLKASVLNSFDSEFGDLRERLRTLGTLIEKHVATKFVSGQLQEARHSAKSRALIQGLSEDAKRSLREERIFRFFQALCRDQKLYESIRSWERSKGTVTWLFSKQEYTAWKENSSSSWLSVKGKLGCGKTVLLANIIDDLSLARRPKSSSSPCISYFFCKSEMPESLKARTIVGTIARQIISYPAWSSRLAKYADSPAVLSTMESMSTSEVADVVLSIIPHKSQPIYIVLDGLDDCLGSEAADLKAFLERLMTERVCLLCTASRGDSFRPLSGRAEYYAVSFDNDSEIRSYVVSEMERRSQRWSDEGINSKLYEAIQTALIKHADGMYGLVNRPRFPIPPPSPKMARANSGRRYLWVALVMDEIFPVAQDQPRPSDSDIYSTLLNLPKSLAEAYDRALSRIRNSEHSRSLFQLVAGALRPLTLKELQEAISVVPGNLNWDPSRLPRDMAKLVESTSGGLLAVNEHSLTVHYVHHTVMSHMHTQPASSIYHFSPKEASTAMMAVCITYLNHGLFRTELASWRPTVKAKTAGAPECVVESTISNAALPTSIGRLLFRRRTTAAAAVAPTIDIAKLLEDARSATLLQEAQHTLHAFLPYARENWLQHSRQITAGSEIVYRLWLNMVRGEVDSVELPWQQLKEDGLEWAYRNAHKPLLLLFLSESDPAGLVSVDGIHQLAQLCRSPEAPVPSVKDIVARVISLGIRMDPGRADRRVQLAIECLINRADVNEPLRDEGSSDVGLTPLALLCSHSARDWILELKRLLEKGANPSLASGPAGVTPLLIAVRNHWIQGVHLLLEFGADPNKGSRATTPLEEIVILQGPWKLSSAFSITVSLLDAGADPFLPSWKSPIRSLLSPEAPRQDDLDLVRRMLMRCEPCKPMSLYAKEAALEAYHVLNMVRERAEQPELEPRLQAQLAAFIPMINDHVSTAFPGWRLSPSPSRAEEVS